MATARETFSVKFTRIREDACFPRSTSLDNSRFEVPAGNEIVLQPHQSRRVNTGLLIHFSPELIAAVIPHPQLFPFFNVLGLPQEILAPWTLTDFSVDSEVQLMLYNRTNETVKIPQGFEFAIIHLHRPNPLFISVTHESRIELTRD